MIVHRDIQQGTSAWLSLRAGIPTASQFDRIITPKGKKSASREKYMYQLLAERIMKHPAAEGPKMWWTERGKELEGSAVQFYELTRGVETEPVGFVTSDNGRRGASPDRLVKGQPGACEFKCPSEAEHLMYLMQSGEVYEAYKIQVQGELNVCEDLEWVDVISYHPELPESVVRIVRDEEFQELLDGAISEFSDDLESKFAICVANGWTAERPMTERTGPEKLASLEDLLKTAKGAMKDIGAGRI